MPGLFNRFVLSLKDLNLGKPLPLPRLYAEAEDGTVDEALVDVLLDQLFPLPL